MFIKKFAFIKTRVPIIKNNNVNFVLTLDNMILPWLRFKGVKTATIALWIGPFIPAIIISMKPGIM